MAKLRVSEQWMVFGCQRSQIITAIKVPLWLVARITALLAAAWLRRMWRLSAGGPGASGKPPSSPRATAAGGR